MNKQDRKAALERFKNRERAELQARMPISPEQLNQLLDHLDENLTSCDHSTKLTGAFLQAENLDGEKVLPWLREHGGHCDCEVLANLEDLNESLKAPAAVPQRAVRRQDDRIPRSLETVAAWNLAKLPTPWRIANLYAPNEPMRLALGKPGGCSVTIVERPLPSGNQGSVEFWSRLWYARTELSARGELQVKQGALELPAGFHSTLVRSPSWTPVYCWIVPETQAWHLEAKTELNRYLGDLAQISTLIARMARGPA